MVVVDLMKIILRGHFLKVASHPILIKLLLWVGLPVTGYYLGVLQPHID